MRGGRREKRGRRRRSAMLVSVEVRIGRSARRCDHLDDEGERASKRTKRREYSPAITNKSIEIGIRSAQLRRKAIKKRVNSLVEIRSQTIPTRPLMIPPLTIMYPTIQLPPTNPLTLMHSQRIFLRLPLPSSSSALGRFSLQSLLVGKRAANAVTLMTTASPHRFADPPALELALLCQGRRAYPTGRSLSTAAGNRYPLLAR